MLLKRSIVALSITALLLSSFAGCGAMFNGSSKVIQIEASPGGTQVTSQPAVGEYTTPTSLELERKTSYVLTFSKEGYQSKTVAIRKHAQFGIILLDILLTGLVGVVVDAATGSWNNLSPDYVSVTLDKIEGAGVDGPDTIEVSVNTSKNTIGCSVTKIESEESVSVDVRAIDG